MHRLLAHFTEMMEWSGAVRACDTAQAEASHKVHQENYKWTTRRGGNLFADEMLQRYYKNTILDRICCWNDEEYALAVKAKKKVCVSFRIYVCISEFWPQSVANFGHSRVC